MGEYAGLCLTMGIEVEKRSLRGLFAWMDPKDLRLVTRDALREAMPLISWLYAEKLNPERPWEEMNAFLELTDDLWQRLAEDEVGNYMTFERFAAWAEPLLGLPLRAAPYGFNPGQSLELAQPRPEVAGGKEEEDDAA